MSVLDIQHLTKIYRRGGMLGGGTLAAVDDVSLTIPGDKPTILSIVGESGSGKTTMARMILRLLDVTEGSITIHNEPIIKGGLRTAEFKKWVQPIFQNPFESFSLRRRVDAYLMDTALNLGITKTKNEARSIISESLEAVGLTSEYVYGKFATQFSGGELQRIAIARALVSRPKLIVADEPVAMIDASLKMNIVNLFLTLKQAYNISFVYITHDLSTAYYVSDYIGIMYRGSLVEFGLASEILTSPSHPYTQLLMNSVPQIGVKWADTVTDADVENRASEGCKFYGRCPFAQDICRTTKPPHVRLSDTRETLCFKAVDYKAI